MQEKHFCVYMMANKAGGTLYIGMTSDLRKRAFEHREGIIDGFTKRYGLKKLVWYEMHENAESAITREKQMKEWQRAWKVKLIEHKNPDWHDLASEL